MKARASDSSNETMHVTTPFPNAVIIGFECGQCQETFLSSIAAWLGAHLVNNPSSKRGVFHGEKVGKMTGT
jgi:hypothetical protein